NVRHAGIERVGDTIEVRFRDAATRSAARNVLTSRSNELNFAEAADGADQKLVVSLKPDAIKRSVEDGVKQNIVTLSKRINELGTTE
ncbi:hypothetical protein KQ718_16835, partial [Listeria monocytogenes]|nr:hypothetical protein [Listeria monocytogenes]